MQKSTPSQAVLSLGDANSNSAPTKLSISKSLRTCRASSFLPLSTRENIEKDKPLSPAIIIKLALNTSYEKTVKAVRETVDPKALGVNVQRLRKTKVNHILVEFPKDNKS